MNLANLGSIRQRTGFVMRLGCCLLCISLLLGLACPLRAHAVEPVTMTVVAVASLAVAYFGACGLTFLIQNMDTDGLVSSVHRLLQEFLDTELGGISLQDWLGTVWDVSVFSGKILMGRPLTNEMFTFAQWVAQKYAAQPGVNLVLSGKSITFADGASFEVGIFDASSVYSTSGGTRYAKSYILGTLIPFSGTRENGFTRYDINSDYYLISYGFEGSLDYALEIYNGSKFLLGSFASPNGADQRGYSFSLSSDGSLYVGAVELRNGSLDYYLCRLSNVFLDLLSGSDLSIDRAPSVSYVPDGITADQGISLDVGASPTMDLTQILQQVLQGVLDGTLTSTMDIADTAPIYPPAGGITDVDGLGLPALGAALVSRFPFSIPWDVAKGVQLLAAPAKAPYWEVDFLAPISYRVGGWKGDTTVVIDMSEFEIIGQLSRWTSTIGFCLLLASGTKRLIWVA